MFQQHHGESLSEAWTHFKDLLQKVPHYGIDRWLQIQIFYDHVNPVTRRTIDQSDGGKLHDLNAEESWALLEDLTLYDNESWNDPRDFAKPVKAIALPQDVSSTSDSRKSSLTLNGISSCSDTTYPNPEQAFVEYASLRTDEAGGKWYTFKPEQNNLGDTYNPSWRSHPNLSLEGLVTNFMASQDARLSKFEADFKRKQGEMANKIDTVLKTITDQIAGTLPSNMVKNPKLSTSLVLSARSYPTKDPQCSTHVHGSINAITIHPKQQKEIKSDKSEEKEHGKEGSPKDTNIMVYNDEQRDASQLKPKGTTIDNLGPDTNDDEIEWLDVEEPLDLVDIRSGRDIHVFVGNMSYVMDFTILENIETNIDPSLSNVVFGRPFVKIVCLTINRKYELMTFTDGIKEITFKTPYKDAERSELSSEGHDLLSSRVILSEDDYDRGCRRPSDLEYGFYRDTIKLGPEYLTGMEDEGEVIFDEKKLGSS
ncbi:hypothetical protein Tco_1090259 [Tanacetum coccineum]|uniref:MAK10-like protein n=1 Tax=Tanacetum coccineum TaxID=301880 RepID=A0ABQ5I3N4_9ASTR